MFQIKQKIITIFFHFWLSKNEELRIHLKHNTTISYASYLLTHSQRLHGKIYPKMEPFVNILLYFSKHLFDRISISLHRKKMKYYLHHYHQLIFRNLIVGFKKEEYKKINGRRVRFRFN